MEPIPQAGADALQETRSTTGVLGLHSPAHVTHFKEVEKEARKGTAVWD